MDQTIKSVTFLGSFPDLKALPEGGLPEIAFAGRSNVGKSSLINMICDRKNIARISGTPGKTQTINLYKVNEQWVLADLPGYGFSKVSKTTRDRWFKTIGDYVNKRSNLACTLVLVDSRIPPQKNDIEFINQLGKAAIPFVIVLTKMDKVSSLGLSKHATDFKAALAPTWEEQPIMLATSAKKKTGRTDLMDLILRFVKMGAQRQ